MSRTREPVNVSERVQPTPETLAKLVPDPLKQLFDSGRLEREHMDAAAEIRAVYLAIVGNMFARAHVYEPHDGHRATLPDWIAEAHAKRYRPWCAEWRPWLPILIGIIVDGHRPLAHHDCLGRSLNDYAARMGLIRSRHTIMTEIRA